ncbi:hypothetical protein BWR17_19610 (plasmid) [Phaeobacter inhibens]|nr:hypothetical protein BWR17_19610 [Phaeobacter inhibens]
MYSSALIPVAPDHRVDTGKLLAVAKELIGNAGQITVLTVVEDIPSYYARDLSPEFHINLTERTCREVAALFCDEDNAKVVAKLGHASSEIVDYADRNAIDCIVLASKRPEFSDIFLGSTATRVARRSNATIVIVR